MPATCGIRTLLVTKYSRPTDTPRAHITDQRTVAVLRDLGVESEALAVGSPSRLLGDTVLCSAAGVVPSRAHITRVRCPSTSRTCKGVTE
ncbi:FAD-dependent monooxygenase [Streptomyces sp. NPDC059766]|uniref:FAD-dependent monooxygenase n=1 Tax=Streptomyces sp. NPDC059766 TaxID=3346940 RepID=UPI00365F43A9